MPVLGDLGALKGPRSEPGLREGAELGVPGCPQVSWHLWGTAVKGTAATATLR